MLNEMGLQNHNNDASLQDICGSLWKQKWLIVIATLIGLFLSLAYLSVAQPIYEAKVFVRPPLLSDIQALNVGRSYSKRAPLAPFELTPVYQTFISALNSDETKAQFFHDSYALSLSEKQSKLPERLQYENYLKAVSIQKDFLSEANGLEKYSVVARSTKPELAEEWVKQHILLADKRAHKEMKVIANTQNKGLASYNQWMVASLQSMAKQEQQALPPQPVLHYAKASNTSLGIAKASAHDAVQAAAHPALQNNAVPMNGQAAENFQTELQAESQMYANIDLTFASFQMYRTDGEVQTTVIWPKQSLIILLGLLAGFMLGCFMAMARNYAFGLIKN